MKKNIIIPTVALFVICLVATTLLAFANSVTEPLIKDIAAKTEIESRKSVLPEAAEFKDESIDGKAYAAALGSDGKTIGYIFTSASKSYGGDLVVMTGVGVDGKVTGIEILQISDTAGLGMKAQNDSFKNQFKALVNGIVVKKNSSNHGDNEITALTGATITSNAVAEAVNSSLELYAKINTTGGAN